MNDTVCRDASDMEQTRRKIRLGAIGLIMLLALIMLKIVVGRRITSVEDMQGYIRGFGVMGPLVLTLFQAFQVVVPVLPGYLGCAAGAVAFGSVCGFVCNYIGISLGSITAFFLARKFGIRAVLSLFSEKQYLKWKKKIEKHGSYGLFLFVATLLPLFPDDFLCYFSGLIRMNTRKFILIIILGKPWCILAYSIVFGMLG